MSKKLDDLTRTKAVLDGLDQTAGQYELIWGVDRLRLLVGDDMRERFDRGLNLLKRGNPRGSISRRRKVRTYDEKGLGCARRRGSNA